MNKSTKYRVIGYRRVSTENQAKEGLSLGAQANRIKTFCANRGWGIAEIIADAGRSGRDLNRPGIQRVISLCRNGTIDAVVIVKLDRLTRSVRDKEFLFSEVFDRNGVKLFGVDESLDSNTASDELSLNVRAAVNQHERRAISERTKAALAYKQARGQWVGRVPIGFRIENGRLVQDAEGQALIARIKRMHRRGKSIRYIAGKLNLSPTTVCGLLNGHGKSRNSRYLRQKASLTVT